MPPGGRKGGNKRKAGRELRLGDLVLAKVKGYPAWPAKISKPEDWERSPDPKKHFVQFFGTSEIAFVAPADITVFTGEVKSKLLVRSQSKKVKFFAQAVEEICKVFDGQQQTSNTAGDMLSQTDEESKRPANDCATTYVDGGIMKTNLKDGNSVNKLNGIHDLCEDDVINDAECSTRATGGKLSSPADEDCNNDLNDESFETEGQFVVALEAPKMVARKGLKGLLKRKVKQKTSDDSCPSALAESTDGYVRSDEDDQKVKIKKMKVSNQEKESGEKKIANVITKGGPMSVKKNQLHEPSAPKLENADNSRPFKRAKFVDDVEMISSQSELGKLTVGRKESSLGAIQNPGASVEGVNLSASRSRVDGDKAVRTTRAISPLAKQRSELRHPLTGSSVRPASNASKRNSIGEISAGLERPLNDARHKRGSCRLGDGEEQQRTPLHRNSFSKVSSPPSRIHVSSVNSKAHTSFHKDSLTRSSNCSGKKQILTLGEKVKTRTPVKGEHNLLLTSPQVARMSTTERKVSMTSNAVSVGSGDAEKLIEAKSSKPISKTSALLDAKKAVSSDLKLSHEASGNLMKARSIMYSENSLQPRSVSQQSKSNMQMPLVTENGANTSLSAEHRTIVEFTEVERFQTVDRAVVALEESKSSDSKSMKQLLAEAQARRNLVHSQFGASTEIAISRTTPYLLSKVSSPSTLILDSSVNISGSREANNVTASDSPLENAGLTVLPNIREADTEHKISPKYRSSGGTFSGGTEAFVSRDALEGMLETLSRTKESIGRATRLAIDCSKYGIATEIVELLIQKLECESSYHRKVDLLFLVDSITQCSHSQKGVAGASYIPAVQAALPRLLAAAAPNGASGRENRKQCLKVLRLWLERKIMPEEFLRKYIDEIDVPNNRASARYSPKRPLRTERSVDDPIREMEGMLVDEYGSNATFELSGMFSLRLFEDDDDFLSCKDCGVNPEQTDAVPAVDDKCSAVVTKNEHQVTILRPLLGSDPKVDSVFEHSKSDTMEEFEPSKSEVVAVEAKASPSLIEQAPPLPMESPPETPPLPLSPPPPPPPLSPAPLPPPPPPPLPPPPLPLLPPPPRPVLQAVKVTSLYQLPVPDYYGQPTAVDSTAGNDVTLQQSSNFHGNSNGNAGAHSAVNLIPSMSSEYGNNSVYLPSQTSSTNYQFQPNSTSYQQGSYVYNTQASILHPHSTPQKQQPTHFPNMSQMNHIGSHNVQQSSSPYIPQTFPNSQLQYPSDEQWRVSPASQKSSWMVGRQSSSSESSYNQDGFLRPNMERASLNSVGYQLPMLNPIPSAQSTSGHACPQMLPGRPDMHSLNCWRPV